MSQQIYCRGRKGKHTMEKGNVYKRKGKEFLKSEYIWINKQVTDQLNI